MPQATVTPIGYNRSLEYAFDELPIFQTTEKGESFHAGLVDGVADIAYDATGDWYVTDLWLRCGNWKLGAASRSKLILLDADRDESLYLLVLDQFQSRHQDTIEERIGEALYEAGAHIAA